MDQQARTAAAARAGAPDASSAADAPDLPQPGVARGAPGADFPLDTVTEEPGVYQLMDAEGRALYVGKAKSLRRRLASYCRRSGLDRKTAAMLRKVTEVQLTVTHSENEALLLEQNLIKALRPPYNIMLRDNKTYPYIHLSGHEGFPRISFHRGARGGDGEYFGPYSSSSSVRQTLEQIQKVFRVRQCEDSVFRHRSRPCLQYQINRCTAPCVGYVSAEDYGVSVQHSRLFLKGETSALEDRLRSRMRHAAQALEFERAAECRDQLDSVGRIRERQAVNVGADSADVLVASVSDRRVCVQQLLLRDGRVQGSHAHFPRAKLVASEAEILSAFIAQYYLRPRAEPAPPSLIVDRPLPDAAALQHALRARCGRKVALRHGRRGKGRALLDIARRAAEQNLALRVRGDSAAERALEGLRELLSLPAAPQRMECFDISHTRGELPVASCVVFDTSGPRKAEYRRFNIEGVVGGDDYAAMAQVARRRMSRRLREDAPLPDILLIDGGPGQVARVCEVLADLGPSVADSVCVVGVAKGPGRRAGDEILYPGAGPSSRLGLRLPRSSLALRWVQQMRDEAHRFAIQAHRRRRGERYRRSALERLPGVGPSRSQRLLRSLGGLGGVREASLERIAQVPGVPRTVAKCVYESFHP